MPTEKGEWLKPAELASDWQVTQQHLASMRFEGRGPRFHKIGQAVRYRRADVEAWLEDQASSNTSRAGASA